jgi:hypothetical protein
MEPRIRYTTASRGLSTHLGDHAQLLPVRRDPTLERVDWSHAGR